MKKMWKWFLPVAAMAAGACDDDSTEPATKEGTRIEVAFTYEAEEDGVWTRKPVAFTNASTIEGSTAEAFEWDFGFEGAGSTSTEENPVAVFPAAGEHTVTLTVTAADGTKASGSQTIIVQRSNDLPQASFTCEPVTPSAGDEVAFGDTSTDADGEIVAWAWNFGDGATSAEQHPRHTFATAGTYKVTLEVTDDSGEKGSTSADLTVSEAPVAKLAWSVEIAAAGQINHGAPAIANGRAYAATTAGELVAVDLATREIAWRFNLTKDGAATGDPMNTPSVDADGTVYFAVGKSSAAYVYAIDGKTGAEKWKYEIGPSGVRVEYGFPLVSDGDYLVAGNRGTNGSIIVLEKATGAQRYREAPSGGVGGCMSLLRNGMIVSCPTGSNGFTLSSVLGDALQIYPKSCNLLAGNNANGVQPAVDRSGRVYLAVQNKATGGGSIGAFDLAQFDGATPLQPLWTVDCEAVVKYSGCVLDADGNVYVVSQEDGSQKGELLAISPTGVKRWSAPLGMKVLCVPAVDNAGHIHLADQSEGYYLVYDSEGNEIFREKACAKAHTSPVIGEDGTVYLLGEKEKGGACLLYAYEQSEATAPAASDWPQYGQNARHTGSQAR